MSSPVTTVSKKRNRKKKRLAEWEILKLGQLFLMNPKEYRQHRALRCGIKSYDRIVAKMVKIVNYLKVKQGKQDIKLNYQKGVFSIHYQSETLKLKV